MTLGRINRANLLKIGAAGVIATNLRLNSPAVTITSPAAGSAVSRTIPVTATYGGPGFRVANLSVDGTQVASTSTQPISFSLDTGKYPDGTHTLGVQVEYRKANQFHWTEAALQLGIRNVPLQVPPGGWVPTAPSSYAMSGTATSTLIDGAIGGASPGYALYPGSLQHIVQNQYGIFASYNGYVDDTTAGGTQELGYFRLKRSQDNAATWSTLYDSQLSNPRLGNGQGTAVETDSAGVIYVTVCNNSWSTAVDPISGLTASQTDGAVRLYRFSPPNFILDAGFPVVISGAVGSAGKRACCYDQTRNWIWYLTGQSWGGPNLFAFDASGAVKYSRSIWFWDGVLADAHETYGLGQYPFLEVDHSGTLYVGWSAESSGGGKRNNGQPQSYYSVYVMWTANPGAGEIWVGAGGNQITLPVSADDSYSPQANPIPDIGNSAMWIAGTDPNYWGNGGTQKYNWTLNNTMRFNKDKLHFAWSDFASNGSGFASQNPYARFNIATHAVDSRIQPFFVSTDGLHTIRDSITACMDSTQGSNRVYLIAGASNTDGAGRLGRVIFFYSDDNGATFNQYALSAVLDSFAATGGTTYLQGTRWVQTDGSLLAIAYSGNNSTASKSVYAIRVV